MLEETVVYEEYTPWAAWVYLLLWGAIVGSAAGVLLGDGPSPTIGRALPAVGLLAFAAILHRFFAGLTVRLTREALLVGLGRGWPLSTRIPYGSIESLESVTYRPLVEFGGWGLRFRGRKRAWTARGNEAVRLHLDGDRDVYVGSDHPRRLEERIRTTAGMGLHRPG